MGDSVTDSWESLFKRYDKQPNKNLKLPNGSRIVVLSDVQIPLHDEVLLDTIIEKFIPWYKPKGAEFHLFLNGDIVDNYSISTFIAHAIPEFILGDEIKATRDFIKKVGARFSHKHYTFGNHEERWERYLFENAAKMAEFLPSLPDVLELDKQGYDWVPYRKHYDVNGFMITHGDSTAKHAADTMLSTYGKSGTSGHINRPQSFTYMQAASSDPNTWYCTGMLCRKDIGDIIPDFRRQQPWQQGFLIGEVQGGVLYPELIRIHHNQFSAAGKVFRVGK